VKRTGLWRTTLMKAEDPSVCGRKMQLLRLSAGLTLSRELFRGRKA